MKKKFHCKIEEMPTIASFVIASFTRDLADFNNYSTLFNQEFLADLDAQRQTCTELIMTDSVNIELKNASKRLYENLKKLRISLVLIEGYIILAKRDLNNDYLGLRKLRLNMKAGNVEGVILSGRSFINNINECKTILIRKGMKQEQIEALKNLFNSIESLNREQNELLSKRSQNCLNNMYIFNNLWDLLSQIFQVGKAIYKSTNEAKLKDYTMIQLKKRMNNERKKAAAADAPAEPTGEPTAEPTK